MKTWIISNLSSLLIAILAILSPIKPLLLTVGFLILMDFIFGIWRAKTLGEKITSRKMSNTLSKMVLYNLAIISVYLLGKHIITTGLPLEKMAAGLIGLTEIKSLSESFEKVFGWNIWDRIKIAIKRGASTTKDLIDIEKETK